MRIGHCSQIRLTFLKNGGRLAFIVSSAILFADYGIPLIRFLARHYKIEAVIDSIVERWLSNFIGSPF